jgi:hypothetical protein
MTYYPLAAAQEVLGALREYAAQAPDEVSAMASLVRIRASEAFPPETHGASCVVLSACWLGPMDQAQDALRPLREAGPRLLDASGSMLFVDLQRISDPGYPWGHNHYWKSIYLDELAPETIALLAESMAECPSPASTVDIWHLGGAISRVRPEETAFARRDHQFLVSIEANWDEKERSAENVAWARTLWEKLRPYSNGGVYQNFPGFREESATVARAAYGVNYDRLARVKAHYDPDNRFRINLNVEPATPGPGAEAVDGKTARASIAE